MPTLARKEIDDATVSTHGSVVHDDGCPAALDAALINLSIVPMHGGIRWLRVHFITLGVLTQVIFGLLPGLVAAWANRPRPSIRWDIWATLNGGSSSCWSASRWSTRC